MIDLLSIRISKMVVRGDNNTSTIRINSMITIFQTTIIAYMIIRLQYTALTKMTSLGLTARAL